jgi:hypothetical protein
MNVFDELFEVWQKRQSLEAELGMVAEEEQALFSRIQAEHGRGPFSRDGRCFRLYIVRRSDGSPRWEVRNEPRATSV